MTPLEPIIHALDFTEAHLQDAINVASMAEAASYSLYHFCRSFSKVTRHTPYDYLMRRRITLAANDIIHTGQKIVDIAFQYQFESHEGFTRAFQRMLGLPPTEARRFRYVPPSGCLPRLTEAHLRHLERLNGLPPEFQTLPEITVPLELVFSQEACAPLLKTIGTNRRALLTLPPTPFDPTQAVTGHCAPFTLPAGDYARFDLTPPWSELPLLLDWILHVWLFYAPYKLRHQQLFIEAQAAVLRVYVPVEKHAG